MPRGGKREGAGRKKASGTKKTRKTSAIAQQAAGEGAQPLEVMLRAMRAHLKAGNLDRAAAVARDAAPYVHPRLAALQVKGGGKDGAIPITVVEVVPAAPPAPAEAPDDDADRPDGDHA